jgi:transcriptional regulator of aromatic amino acid metabolism
VNKASREFQELMTVTALMTEPVIACDECGQMVFANLAAKTLFGEIQPSMDDCPETLGIFDSQGERMLEIETPMLKARLKLALKESRKINCLRFVEVVNRCDQKILFHCRSNRYTAGMLQLKS